MPPYCGITGAGKLYTFEHQAGRPAVLVLVGALDLPESQALMNAVWRRRTEITSLGADAVVMTTDDPEAALGHIMRRGPTFTIATEAGDFRARAGFTDTPRLVVADRNLRIVGLHADAAPDQMAAAALTEIASLHAGIPEGAASHAPVLMIPNVMSGAFCARLIDLFHAGGHFDSGFMSVDDAGRPLHKIDHSFKRRADHFLQPGHPLHGEAMDILSRRIAPEIAKSFNIHVAHCERFLIARYDHTGGYFRRHRDTTGAANAHRQFAITLNLNTGDYDGGHLTFPEYGPQLYRPPAGGALIFSGALLHEALPVTAGTRYALLGFLHDEAAEARRQSYLEGASAAQ